MTRINDALQRLVVSKVTQSIAQEYRAQGHTLTGTLEKSLEGIVKETAEGTSIEFYLELYGIYLNNGVSPERIPYTPGESRGKTSKYIQALIAYAEKRLGSSGAEAKSMAFAIARKQKQVGMPTPDSAKYSTTGQRIGAISIAVDNIRDEIEKIIYELYSGKIEEIYYSI